MARITETVYQESAPKVDIENGVLYGVKLLGEVSKNGRRYKPEAMKKAVPLYEGRKSYVDHPEHEKLAEDRKFRDWSGEFRNARYVEGRGIFADQHLRKEGDYFAGIIEAAQRFPTAVGYSHVADGASRMDGDTEIIESITEVFSVDLVTDPATTAGFFESRRKPKTIKHAIESLPDGTVRTRLIEMMDDGYLDGALSMGGEKSDPQSQMYEMARALVEALIEMARNMAEASKPEPVPPPLEEPAKEPAAEPVKDLAMTPEAEKEDKQFPELESVKRENSELKAKNLLLESDRDATPARIKALAAATDDDRKELLESWPAIEAGERPLRSPALSEGGAPASPQYIRERFASLLT
jgi:hypothetical protein